MVNKEKSLERERVRLRKSQNPQQIDFKRMDKKRSVRSEFWKLKKKGIKAPVKAAPAKKAEKKQKPLKEKKKEKEPELEVIEEELETVEEEPEVDEIDEELEADEEEPEIEEIGEELEDLYTYDEEFDEEFDDVDDTDEPE
jgi:hypothetical protein